MNSLPGKPGPVPAEAVRGGLPDEKLCGQSHALGKALILHRLALGAIKFKPVPVQAIYRINIRQGLKKKLFGNPFLPLNFVQLKPQFIKRISKAAFAIVVIPTANEVTANTYP